jgi:hypothetical protein
LPQVSALDRAGAFDALALQCAASAGENCGGDATVATDERD